MTFWEYTFAGLAWLLKRPAYSATMPEWMATTKFNALDSDEYPADDIVSRYWVAQRQMVKKPSAGVG
ncbi:hypothetical protein TNCV_72421 [Trichonephila clavipes]|uniref:Uncharacterized protein n=1 Tax=Trichonephila clavipes TaxID=2585209 RepID=A0A8X6V1C3_TRICX|nr:hypothetical protein TNCV_72421 [Trichonephila clavipes]